MFEIFASREIDPDLVSRAIMLATKADFSHVGIIVDGQTIWHATGKGFHSMPLDEFMRDHLFAHRFQVRVDNRAFALGWLHGSSGKGYGSLSYPGFLIDALKEIGDDNDRRLVCSEAVVLFGAACCGLEFCDDADFVDPKRAIELMRRVAA